MLALLVTQVHSVIIVCKPLGRRRLREATRSRPKKKGRTMVQPTQSTARNHLLQMMAPDDYALLQPHIERVHLKKNDTLIAPNEPIKHVYFPENSLASIVAISPEGNRIEAGIFGHEGTSAVPLILGAETTPLQYFIQIADGACRIGAPEFRSALAQSPTLLALFLRYAQSAALQTSHTALSNALHSIDERLARWLLMCHDRMDGDELNLTHDFLSLMLGVRRAGVTTSLHVLEGIRFISASRGRIIIKERAALEDFAADAYGVPEAEYARLMRRRLSKKPHRASLRVVGRED